MKTLITGAAGRLGCKLTVALQDGHDLVLGDVTPLEDPRFAALDVTDLQAARAAAEGCEAIVHLAMADWASASTEDELRHGARALQVHAAGTCNMLRAGWEARVRRFVHISSVSAVEGLPAGTPCGPGTRHYSNCFYGLTKGFGEDLCRLFHCSFGVSTAVLRLGTVYNPAPGGAWLGNVFTAEGEPLPADALGSRVHVDDVTRAISLALEAAACEHALAHIVGAGSGARWDLQTAWRLYGWAPRYGFDAAGLPYLVA